MDDIFQNSIVLAVLLHKSSICQCLLVFIMIDIEFRYCRIATATVVTTIIATN